MDNQKIGNFIKKIRNEKGLTQKDLADKLNITDRAVSKWERGLNCPDISLLDDLSRILEVSVIEILKGRKLAKDELINNKELVETMTFANKSLKEKIKKLIDLISITIVSLVSLLLLFYNIKGFYYSHKTYVTTVNNDEYVNKYTNGIENILNDINLIENNQGIYTEEEYKLIKEYIRDVKTLINKDIEKEILSKKTLTIKDFNKFFNNMSIYDICGYDSSYKYRNIYKIILKYNIDKYDNMLNYNSAQKLYTNGFTELSSIYYPIYQYGYRQENLPYESYMQILINLKYTTYKMILNDIIEVGEINE